jgi:ketosteroid isomerase-like protein
MEAEPRARGWGATVRLMAKEDVERFGRAVAAYNRRDLEGFLAVCDPDVESHPITAAAEGGAYRGHEGVRRWWENMETTWGDSLHAEAMELRDLGDCLLALGRLTGRGLGSGIELDTEVGWLVEFRNGRMTRWWAFSRHADALAAAGLRD